MAGESGGLGVGELWAHRVEVEIEAAARFEAIATGLRRMDAPSVLILESLRCAADERHHAVLCSEIAAAHGVESNPRAPFAHRWLGPASLSHDDRLLYEVVAVSCVVETVATALQVHMLKRMAPSPYRRVLREVARDEVRHARLGWSILGWAGPRAEVLMPYVPMLIEQARQEGLQSGVDDPVQIGELPSEERRRVVDEAVQGVVLPGLAAVLEGSLAAV